MFEVRITTPAKALIANEAVRESIATPCLMIHRVGPKADVTRSQDGGAMWAVDRPHPWSALVNEASEDNEDEHLVDGVRVWLALIPRDGELGVEVAVHDGKLWVEAIEA